MSVANTINEQGQARSFRRAVKVRLAEMDLTVTRLAEELGLARNTVSIAINHPTMLHGVKRRIRKELRLS